MIEEKLQTDLDTLSRAWSEKIKEIRKTALQDNLLTDPDSNAEVQGHGQDLPVPSDSDLFVGQPYPDLILQQQFASDQNGILADDGTNTASSSERRWSEVLPLLSIVGKWVIGIVVAIALGLVSYSMYIGIMSNQGMLTSQSELADQKVRQITKSDKNDIEDTKTPKLDNDKPISMKIAQDYYSQGRYDKACIVYKQLIDHLDPETREFGLEAYLDLKIALCKAAAGKTDHAVKDLTTLSHHHLPVIRGLANYSLCLEELERRQYLSARTHAYRAAALLGAGGDSVQELVRLRRNCDYLFAESLTRHVLMLLDVDTELPKNVWGIFQRIELDQLIEENDLSVLLTAGSQRFNQAALKPFIETQKTDSVPLLTVISKGASFEELVGRFSAGGVCNILPQAASIRTDVWSRPVYVYSNEEPWQQTLSIVAGCTGQVAIFNEDNSVTVYDSVGSSYTHEQIMQLCNEAVIAWQRFMFRHHNDPQLANIHFLQGILNSQRGYAAEALAQYKMVANRFYRSALAPTALVNSAMLKTSLNDYSGAYSDLTEAVHQYPDYEAADYACLLLANVAEQMNRTDEAVSLYSKVYFINRSVKTRATAALKTGQIHYLNRNYELAKKWLNRYVELAPETRDSAFYQACLFLGLTWKAMGNTKSACEALELSLSEQLSEKDYIQAVRTLVECLIERGSYVKALNTLNTSLKRPLERRQSVELLLLRSRSLRSMGMIDQAVALLKDRQDYLIDKRLKAEVGYELSQCLVQQDNLKEAHKVLMKVLDHAESGTLAENTMLQLAQVCVKLDQDSQAMNMCSKLMDLQPGEEIENQIRTLLAAIHRKQKNYDHAILSLLGQAD